MKFSFTKESDLCTNCFKHKAVVSNITYQSFDKNFKFYPVCVDCFDIDEFNESTSRFIRQGHFYFGRWVPGERPKIFLKGNFFFHLMHTSYLPQQLHDGNF